MSTQVKIVVENLTATQNAIKNVEVREANEDETYRVAITDPRPAEASYTVVDGDTPTDVAEALATDLDAADGVTATATDENIEIEVIGGEPIVLAASRWMLVTDVQKATKAEEVVLEYLSARTVPVGGTLNLEADLDAIKANGVLESLRGDDLRGVISLRVLPLNEGEVEGDLALTSDQKLDDVIIEGNLDISGGITVEATDMIVRGDLTVDETSNIDFAKVEVLGAVSFDSGAGTVSWKGGAFHGAATDPDSKLGAASSGDYLSV